MFHEARSLATRAALGWAVQLVSNGRNESFPRPLHGTGSRAPASSRCRGGNPQTLRLPLNSAHNKRPGASRSLLQFAPPGPPFSPADREVPAGSRRTSAAAPSPAALRPPRPPRRAALSAPRQRPQPLLPAAPAPHLAPRSAPTAAAARGGK